MIRHSLFIAVALVALLVFSSFSYGSGEKAESQVNIKVVPSRSAVNITFNKSDFFEISFITIYAGTLDLFKGPMLWYAKLNNMNYHKEYGKNEEMGEFLHIRMWKNVTLKRMYIQWGQEYSAAVTLDFYVASKNYTKGKVLVDVNTLRYDVRIDTDCPADFIYLDHRIKMKDLDSGKVMAQIDDESEEIEKRHGMYWLNASEWGEVKFMNDDGPVHYSWDAERLEGVKYEYWDGYMDVYFIYKNTGTIVQDPYIKLPMPFFSNETAGKIVNYFMEHVTSISVGIAAAMAVVLIPAVLKRRRL